MQTALVGLPGRFIFSCSQVTLEARMRIDICRTGQQAKPTPSMPRPERAILVASDDWQSVTRSVLGKHNELM